MCAFTGASVINNRALLPCQEPPIAMATWQAEIRVPEGYVVLCTGDEEGTSRTLDEGTVGHYFYKEMVKRNKFLRREKKSGFRLFSRFYRCLRSPWQSVVGK